MGAKGIGVFILIAILAMTMIDCVSISVMAQPPYHIYYGYVPPSTDLPTLDEIVNGRLINFTPPSGHALLDVIALSDNTRVEIYDIVSGLLLNATILNRMEKEKFYIPYGTYFKVVASQRVLVMLTGGWAAYDVGEYSGVSTFYPTVGGGFRGREWIFMPAPATHQYGYRTDLVHFNFYLLALEDLTFTLADRIDRATMTRSIKRGGFDRTVLQSRANHLGPTAAIGYDSIFKLSTTGEAMVLSATLGMFVYVPALTGGFVGRSFWVPNHAARDDPGRRSALIIVPLEAGRVTVIRADTKETIAEKEFTERDVAEKQYWFVVLGRGRIDVLIKSTCDITVLACQTLVDISPFSLSGGIAFLGSRPNQEIRFFTPVTAIVFSPEDQVAVINGEEKTLKRDSFVVLGSGVHSVKGSGYLVVQLVNPGPWGFEHWGHYLIEPADIAASYPDIPELFEAGLPVWVYAVTIIAILTAVGIILRRLRTRRKA